MQKTIIFLSFFFSLSMMSLHASATLDYLNALRTQTGAPAFTAQSNLDTAAQNHSNYMQINNEVGHYEDSTKVGFTGYDPTARTIYSNYASRIVGENVAAGQATSLDAIDSLFSAIYHRFGFLNLTYDEVGIGINSTYYTFNMGNTLVNTLCESAVYTGGSYVSGICSDSTKKIDLTDWNEAIDTNKNNSPALIVWPPVNSEDILPVFYEESPDPLPTHSVTGYPVSVEFNDIMFDTPPVVSSFTLTNETTNTLQSTLVVMNETNDPNSMFTANQTALFPEKRLEWGEVYRADLTYTYGSASYSNSWCFSTRSLVGISDKFYRIENNTDITLNVVSGQRYAVYIVPNNTNDRLGSASWSFTSDAPQFSYVDGNTVLITITGTTGEYANFTFGNGQKVNLIVATSDTAIVPSSKICTVSDASIVSDAPIVDFDGDGIADSIDSDDDNDGILDRDELANGLNPFYAADAQLDLDGDGFSNVIEISLGTNIRSASSTPIWTPIMMGEIITFVPSAP